MLPIGYLIRLAVRLMPPGVGLAMGVGGAALFGQTVTDPIERSIAFVEKSEEAQDLYNRQHYAEALPVFETLVKSLSDQDVDGFAALGLGDCLAALNRYDDARAAYLRFVPRTPAQQSAVNVRLEDLELKGTVSEATLERLRVAAQQTGPERSGALWRLGRALQKRAADLLAEGGQVFRAAADATGERPCTPEQLASQGAYLDELADDLRFLIAEVEGYLQLPTNLNSKGEPVDGKLVTEEWQSSQVPRLADGRRVRIEVRSVAPGAALQIKLDGREIKLTPAQLRLLQRHQDRMYAIILEAAGHTPPAAAARAGSSR